jgi:hypothetical protein
MPTKLTPEERLEKVERILINHAEEIQVMQNLAKELNMWKVQGQLTDAMFIMDKLNTTVSEFNQRLKAIEQSDQITLFDDDKLKDLYIQSGLGTVEVKEFIRKITGNEVSDSTCSNIINGKTNDLKLRSQLGRYYKVKISQDHATPKSRKTNS